MFYLARRSRAGNHSSRPCSQLIKGLLPASLRKNTIPTSIEQGPVKSELSEGPKAMPAKQHRAGGGQSEGRAEEGRGGEKQKCSQ